MPDGGAQQVVMPRAPFFDHCDPKVVPGMFGYAQWENKGNMTYETSQQIHQLYTCTGMCGALVGGLLVGACVVVFGWLPLGGGVVGLRSKAEATRLCVCL